MANTLYMECSSGISGDMTVAALLDLGADREVLERALHSLPLDGFAVQISRVRKSGLDVCDFAVILDKEHENHDHDMKYLHGSTSDAQEHPHDREASHGHEHGQPHEQEASHGHEHGQPYEQEGSHRHEHRGLREILHIIEHASLTDRARETAKKIFTILAEAEARAHGLSVEEVHFHEVGAVDSIVDIVAAAVCLDTLDIEDVVVTELNEGRGFVRCQHGIIPVPVPAVVNIAEAYKLSLHITSIEGELVTPTGAAIAAAIATKRRLPEHFQIKKTGMGAGKRNYESPGILRAMLIEEVHPKQQDAPEKTGAAAAAEATKMAGMAEATETDVMYCLETNIDDCTGEALGLVMERLFGAGARDVHYIPVFMKKNRPAYQLNVICTEELIPVMERIIFRETTTIGIRRTRMERTTLKRIARKVKTELGTAEVKQCMLPDGSRRYYPEYEQTAMLAEQNNISYMEAYQRIRQTAMETDEI